MRAKPLPLLLRTPDGMEIPHLRSVYSRAKEQLDQGCGFVVLNRMPIDNYEIDEIIACYWVLGQLLGPTVAQKWDGTMIYDVTDTKQTYGYGVRGSATSVELVCHTDNAFGMRVVDEIIGAISEAYWPWRPRPMPDRTARSPWVFCASDRTVSHRGQPGIP